MKRSMKREFNLDKYRLFREDVIKRDKYMCAKCKVCAAVELDVELCVHLLDNKGKDEKYVSSMDNAVTLCCLCHNSEDTLSFHKMYGEENNTRDQYEEWIKLNQSQEKHEML